MHSSRSAEDAPGDTPYQPLLVLVQVGPDRLGDRGRALGAYFYHRMDDEIRRRFEDLFAKQYPNLQIKIRSAVLLKGEGISVRGLSIVDPAAEGPCPELLTYDECFVACPTDLSDLMSGEPRATQVILRRPTLRMTRRSDGTWRPRDCCRCRDSPTARAGNPRGERHDRNLRPDQDARLRLHAPRREPYAIANSTS